METFFKSLFSHYKKEIELELQVFSTKAKKFGVDFQYEFSKPYILKKEIPSPMGDFWNEQHGYHHIVTYEVFDLNINHEPIKLSGDWELVAYYKNDTGSIQQLNVNLELPKWFVEHEINTCNHCNIKRYRKTYFLVYSPITKEFKQIGSTCLKDFCGITPAKALKIFSFFYQPTFFGECENYSFNNASKQLKEKFVNIAYSKSLCISKILEFIKLHNYTKATFEQIEDGVTYYGKIKYKWVRDNEGKATLDKLIQFLESKTEKPKIKGAKDINDLLKFWDNKEIKTDKDNIPINSFNFWISDCKEILTTDYILKTDLNKLCGLVNYYVESKAKESEISSSKHFGNIGERITQDLIITKMFAGDGLYGSYYIYTMENENGNCFVYKGSKQIGWENDKLNITFTITSHDTYNGMKQTIISRPKILTNS